MAITDGGRPLPAAVAAATEVECTPDAALPAPPEALPCIGTWQPWASLLAHGLQKIHTSTTPWTGPLPCMLGVYALQSSPIDLAALLRMPVPRGGHAPAGATWGAALAQMGCVLPPGPGFTFHGRPWLPLNAGLPAGALVGLVRLVACYSVGTLLAAAAAGRHPGDRLTDQERVFGDFSPGRCAWVCDRAHRFARPVATARDAAAAARQGLWHWREPPPEVLALARALRGGSCGPAAGGLAQAAGGGSQA